ncbi:hypothetical protein G9A89_003794 [Geosiphon pyriformis]|nr:hypothetical protein G9A89_003794 [Geosiphon pyriformis]
MSAKEQANQSQTVQGVNREGLISGYDDPFGLGSFRREIERLMNEFTASFTGFDRDRRVAGQGVLLAPPIDVRELDNEFVVHVILDIADLPGVPKEKVNVELRENKLVISGEAPKEETQGQTLINERRAGKFMRNIRLPGGVDAEKIQARFDHGVLEVRIPRTTEAACKRVPIQ